MEELSVFARSRSILRAALSDVVFFITCEERRLNSCADAIDSHRPPGDAKTPIPPSRLIPWASNSPEAVMLSMSSVSQPERRFRFPSPRVGQPPRHRAHPVQEGHDGAGLLRVDSLGGYQDP